MVRRIISLAASAALLMTNLPAAYAAEPSAAAEPTGVIEEFVHDFNDGSLKNVGRQIDTVGTLYNQEYYASNHVTIEDRSEDGTDKYAELGSGENSTAATFIMMFPETLYGRVVVEADFMAKDMTAMRNLFQVITHDEQAVFNLQLQSFYYSLNYERNTADIFPIPIDGEWHRFRAVIDTDEDNFMLYCDGVACMSEPFGMNRGATAKAGISGIRSQINYDLKRGDKSGITGIDNIRAYTISKEAYTGFSSDTLCFDYEYRTVSNAVKGTTVGEFLSQISLNDEGAVMQVLEDGFREKSADEVMYAGDELVITYGRQREFYDIRLEENNHAQYFMHTDSPEIFAGENRKQIDDDNCKLVPFEREGELYLPIGILDKLFDCTVRINNDTGCVMVTYNGSDTSLYIGSDIFKENGELYFKGSLLERLGIKYAIDENGLIMLGEGDFNITESERKYIERTFIFKADSESTTVIKADGDIKAALDKAAEALKSGDVVIDLGSDRYYSTETIVIKNDTENKLTLRGNADNHAQITGGMHLTTEDFEPVPNASVIKKRLPQISADKIVMVSLAELGIEDIGQITPQGHTFEIKPSELTLYADGAQQTMARYPNEGFVYTGAVLNTGYGNPTSGLSENEFQYTDTRVENWQLDGNIYMFGFWNNEYTNSQARLKNVDKKHKGIMLDGVLRGQLTATNRPYYYFNVLEEMDLPGEYVIDFNTKMLYYYPTESFSENGIDISVAGDTMIELDRAKNVVIESIDFSYCRDIAIKERKCHNTLIKDCSFNGIGTYAIQQNSSNASGVYGCDINQTGAHSIMLEGGSLYTLTKSDNYVINTRVRNNGMRRHTYSGMVLSRGCGNYIYRNSFRDSEHMGVYVFGAKCRIENNSFSNMCTSSGDAGCVYMAGCWYTADTQTIGNYFENMSPHPEIHAGGNTAVYYDNSTSHTTTYGNIMNDTVMAVMSNCGRFNRIYGNSFNAMKTSAGSIGAAVNAGFTSVYDTLRMVPYAGKIWSEEIPLMAQLKTNYNPTKPIGTEVHNNIWQDTVDFSVTAPKISLEYDNVTSDAEDLFMDRDNKDFRIKSPGNYNSILVDGEVDYANMGTGADFGYGENKQLERVFVSTDISKADKANIYMSIGDFSSLYVKARDVDGNIIDSNKLNVSFSVDSDNAAVSANGVLYAVKPGKATVTAAVAYKGKVIKTDLIVYTDEAEWAKNNLSNSEREIVLSINDVDTGIGAECESEKGTLLMPAGAVLKEVGYTESVNGDTYTYSKDSSELVFTVGSAVFDNNGAETALSKAAYLKDGKLYVPFNIFEDLAILNIYSEAARTAKVYLVNMANGEECIPEGVNMIELSDLIKDSDGWTSDTTAKYANDGTQISFGYDTASGKNCVLGYSAEVQDNNSMYSMECEWNSDTFIAFAFRISDPTIIPWRGNGVDSYYILVKPDSIEVQKRVNSTTTFILDNVPNKYFKPGESCKVSVGVIDTEEGPRAVLNINGHSVIDAVDKINYSVSGNTRTMGDKLANITEKGYISFVLYSSAAGASSAYFKLK